MAADAVGAAAVAIHEMLKVTEAPLHVKVRSGIAIECVFYVATLSVVCAAVENCAVDWIAVEAFSPAIERVRTWNDARDR
jgi:hypothetical protein